MFTAFKDWRLSSATILTAMAVAFIFTGGTKAWAQDGHHGQGHAENHGWYEKLKQPGSKASCCNTQKTLPNGTIEGDCRPTRAYQVSEGRKCGSHSVPEGSWCALIDGRWTPVPPRVVLKELAPDGNSHICANPSGVIFCFLGGSPKS